MRNTKRLLLLLSCSFISCLDGGASVGVGASLKIILQRRPTSELDTTILNSANLTLIRGDIPFPPPDGIEGELVPFNPLNACTPGAIEKRLGRELDNVIVLVSRDSCSIETKIENVSQVRNVLGILVYNDRLESHLAETLHLSNDFVGTIPGFIINYSIGRQLLDIYKEFKNQNSQDRQFWIKIILSYIEPNNTLTTILQWSLIGIIILLAIAFAISVVMHLKMRGRDGELEEENENGEGRDNMMNGPENLMTEIDLDPIYHTQLGKDRLEKLKVRVFSKKPIEEEGRAPVEYELPSNETCPICLDDFIEGETLNELLCMHCYHIGCIQPWLLNRSPLCPMCKEDVRDSFNIRK